MKEYKNFLSACDVAEILEISTSKAYKIIRQLNNELEEKGFITIHGKISKPYFESRFYSRTSA